MPRIKTEQAWFNSTTPHSLLLTLKGKRMPRQRRLFAVACCRRWLHEMLDPESRLAVEVAERYADGLADRNELEAAYRAAQEIVARRITPCQPWMAPGQPVDETALGQAWSVWRLAHIAQIACSSSGTQDVVSELLKRANRLGEEHEDQEKRWLSDGIRDIFGNPFRPPPSVNSSWLSWNEGTIPKLAQAIYHERALPSGTLDGHRLAVLADALEEAGCTNPDILNHCRQPGEHVRGCWLVDLLLNKS